MEGRWRIVYRPSKETSEQRHIGWSRPNGVSFSRGPAMDTRQEVRSLKKGLRALMFLNSHGESTVTDVARAIGVPRTTSYRLLETLAAEGYVEKQPHSDIYRLTSAVHRLASGFGDSDLVVEVAKPLIAKIGAEIGWPMALATPRGKDMVVRITTDHDTSLAIDRYTIGFKTPILHAPAGLCYLAYCDDELRNSILELSRESETAVSGPRNNAYILNQIRARRYCHIHFAEYQEDGLAVPLIVGGHAVGGIVMRYIKSSIKFAKIEGVYVPILQKLAEDISAAYEARISGHMLQENGTVVPFTQTKIKGASPMKTLTATASA
jgi:IclR family mhp operon transcriptional activator